MNREVVVFLGILVLVVAVAAAVLTLNIPLYQILIGFLLIAAFWFISPKLVEFKEFERGVQFRFGKFMKVAGPGWLVFWPAFESFTLVDLRTTVLDLPKQEVITKDDVEISVDAVIYERVVDSKKAVIEVKDYKEAMRELLKSEVRNTVGKMDLEEVLERTEEINTDLKAVLKRTAEDWGIAVLNVEIQHIKLPSTLIEALHKRREADAYKTKLEIESQAKQLSIDIIDKATSKMSDKTIAYLYLDSLKSIANGRANKIIFPLELSHLANSISNKLPASSRDSDSLLSSIVGKLGVAKKK